MEIHCKINRKELAEGIRRIRQSLGRVRKNSTSFQLEIEFRRDRMFLKIPGVIIEIESQATGEGSFQFPFQLLGNLPKTLKTDEIEFTVSDHYLNVKNGPEVENDLIESLNGLESLVPDLPMNYTDRHILGLRSKYSERQLKKMGVDSLVEKAEYNYEVAISNAYKTLKLYGVTIAEIRELADRKI